MPEEPTTLRDMIQNALTSGLTYRQLEARATDPLTGATVSRGTLNKLGRDMIPTMPSSEQLRAVAAALRAPYESVRQAAIAQWLPPAAEAEAERERLELLAEAKRLRDQANETIARLEQQERDEVRDGGRRAG